MIFTIQNDQLTVRINSVGAELSSIITKKDNKEYLWQGDPTIWASQAPVLFPIVGGLKNGTYHYKDQQYGLPKHGFIRYNTAIEGIQNSETKVSFTLSPSEETIEKYPFQFTFTISYELVENQLIVSHTVENTDTKTMYFSIGGHPAFNCPIDPSENYEDYFIELEQTKNTDCFVLTSDGLISDETISVIKDHKIWLTDTIFDKDALIFKDIQANKATLIHKEKGAILSMDFKDFPDLGIWAKPKAPYVCIEPWLGYADVISTTQNIIEKECIQHLEKEKIHRSSYSITITNA
ncbi:aldose 1-epimerase family protein [Aquimarina litoralis]|uniref:Aldose 1-epimerase family protein n=1 Tax=Aquimarina litoralis TaxID=584605 RepID=A0ABP3UFN5_9FLAO